MNIIKTYSKGGISNIQLDKEKDILISIQDFTNKKLKKEFNSKSLDLYFDDINDSTLNRLQVFAANRISKDKHISKYSFLFGKGWPIMPFTPYHASLIIDFIENTPRPYEKNWHIHCEYGRSRSVAIAMFMKILFPKHKIILTRDVSRPNKRVLKLLLKEWGVL